MTIWTIIIILNTHGKPVDLTLSFINIRILRVNPYDATMLHGAGAVYKDSVKTMPGDTVSCFMKHCYIVWIHTMRQCFMEQGQYTKTVLKQCLGILFPVSGSTVASCRSAQRNNAVETVESVKLRVKIMPGDTASCFMEHCCIVWISL